MKIIQISSSSPSYFLNSGKGDMKSILKDDWFAQVAINLKNISPKLKIECWAPEKIQKKEENMFYSGIRFRIFPAGISIRPGFDISISMIKAILKEQKEAIKRNEALILHFHEYHSFIAYSLLLFKNKKIKIIAQHHGGRSPFKNLIKYKRFIAFLPLIILMQFFEKLLFKKIDIFYALGDEEIEYLRKIAPNSEIKFQTMGIEDKYFNIADKRKARKITNLDLKKRYILYIGRIKTTKGIKELLDAVKKIDAELLLIGNGPDKQKYEDYIKKNKIGNVNFLGSIYNDKKLEYFSACDCLILPSQTEGAPVVLMEAIARNLPVVATNVGGVSKMIKNGREGIIIRPNSKKAIFDALKKILTWKNKPIRKYAYKYKWEEIIKNTLKDYEK